MQENSNATHYSNTNNYSNNSSLSHCGYGYQATSFFDDDSTNTEYSSDLDNSYHCDSLPQENCALDPFFWINRWSEAQQEIEPSQDVAPQDLVFQRLQKMAIVATDFVHVAEHYGKIIISEFYLDNSSKSIPEAKALGGTAGGTKYHINGIIFKFSVDVMLNDVLWMYGGESRDDEKAMKSACNERKGWMALFQTTSTKRLVCGKLNFPLLSVIHYKGFCLIAITKLHLRNGGGNNSLVYGSADGGNTVFCDPNAFALMKDACQQINIGSHVIKDKEIYGPADMEVHMGEDGKYYCLDFARLMPPEGYHGVKRWGVRSIFYNLLRPALVISMLNNNTPLVSDAFSSFMERSVLTDYQNGVVKNVGKLLYKQIIPNFAHNLEEIISTKEHEVRNHLIFLAHRKGINCRNLGYVRRFISETGTKVKEIILTELVARVMKNQLRKELRIKMEEKKISSDSPYKQVIYEYLKRILANVQQIPTTFIGEGVQVYHDEFTVHGEDQLCNIFGNIWTSEIIYFELLVQRAVPSFAFGLTIWDSAQNNNLCLCRNGSPFYIFNKECGHAVNIRDGDLLGVYWSGKNADSQIWFLRNKIPISVIKLSQFTTTIKSVIPTILASPGLIVKQNFGPNFTHDVSDLLDIAGLPAYSKVYGSEECNRFWNFDLKYLLKSKFPHALTRKEKDENNLRALVDIPLLIKKFQEMTGIELSNRINGIKDIPSDAKFDIYPHDIIHIHSRSSNIGIIDLVEIMRFFRNKQDYVVTEVLLNSMVEKMVRIVDSAGTDQPIHYHYWGKIYLELAEISTILEQKKKYYKFSAEKFQVITDRVNQSKILDVSDCFTGLCFEASIDCAVSYLLYFSDEILKSEKKKDKKLKRLNIAGMYTKLFPEKNASAFILSLLQHLRDSSKGDYIAMTSIVAELICMKQCNAIKNKLFHEDCMVLLVEIYLNSYSTQARKMNSLIAIADIRKKHLDLVHRIIEQVIENNEPSHVEEFQKKLLGSLLPSPSLVHRDQLFAVMEMCLKFPKMLEFLFEMMVASAIMGDESEREKDFFVRANPILGTEAQSFLKEKLRDRRVAEQSVFYLGLPLNVPKVKAIVDSQARRGTPLPHNQSPKMSSANLPNVNLPSVNLPNVSFPNVSLPNQNANAKPVFPNSAPKITTNVSFALSENHALPVQTNAVIVTNSTVLVNAAPLAPPIQTNTIGLAPTKPEGAIGKPPSVPSLWVNIQLTMASEWNGQNMTNPSQLKLQFIVKPSGQVTGLNRVDGNYRMLSGYFNREKKSFEVIAIWGDSERRCYKGSWNSDNNVLLENSMVSKGTNFIMKMAGKINIIEKDFQYTYLSCHVHEVFFDTSRYESHTFGCNICGTSSNASEPCWQCNTCQFDAHASCSIRLIVPKPATVCTAFHVRHPFTLVSQINQKCSFHSERDLPAAHYSCQTCNLHLCEECELSAVPLAFKHSLHEHTLISVEKREQWSCNGIKFGHGCKSKTSVLGKLRFRCQACDFDLCEPCVRSGKYEWVQFS